MGWRRNHIKVIKDFILSTVAYVLPTIVIQLAIQPIIAKESDVEVNSSFITLYSVIKLCSTVLILSLSNVRLLRKKEGIQNEKSDKAFNLLFLAALIASVSVTVGMYFLYAKTVIILRLLLLLVFLTLVCIHDYYSIEFRLELTYSKLVIDNSLIVAGFLIGLLLFNYTGIWEWIFISGYACGVAYVLITTKLWRKGMSTRGLRTIMPGYGQLASSNALSSSVVYCDKLLINPILGDLQLSIYNSSAVVSKIISLVNVPLNNVLLSYIVDNDTLIIKKKWIKKYGAVVLVAIILVYAAFCGTSFVGCKLLYPKYADSAVKYIPIIVAAMLFDSLAGLINIALLRFGNTAAQTVIAATKMGVYLFCIVLLTIIFKFALMGFCISILIADLARLVFVGLKSFQYVMVIDE
jgi:O-antigen/teichoic acid export membrane protein